MQSLVKNYIHPNRLVIVIQIVKILKILAVQKLQQGLMEVKGQFLTKSV
jgi:hypothetical protein